MFFSISSLNLYHSFSALGIVLYISSTYASYASLTASYSAVGNFFLNLSRVLSGASNIPSSKNLNPFLLRIPLLSLALASALALIFSWFSKFFSNNLLASFIHLTDSFHDLAKSLLVIAVSALVVSLSILELSIPSLTSSKNVFASLSALIISALASAIALAYSSHCFLALGSSLNCKS